jgi:hypothetical protein
VLPATPLLAPQGVNEALAIPVYAIVGLSLNVQVFLEEIIFYRTPMRKNMYFIKFFQKNLTKSKKITIFNSPFE